MIGRHRVLSMAGGASSKQPVLSQPVFAALVLTCFAWCMCGQAAYAPDEACQDQRRENGLRENRLFARCTTGHGQHSVPSNHRIAFLVRSRKLEHY